MAAKKAAPAVKKSKTYETFGGILKAKSKGALPRGVKARILKGETGDFVIFEAGGSEIARLDLATFAAGELARHDFRVAK